MKTKTNTRKSMTTRKAKMREERYTSMEDVLRSGKYKGRTIKEMLEVGNYINDCYKRGSIVMSRSLWMQCLDYRSKHRMAAMERKEASTNQMNSYKKISKHTYGKAKRLSGDTDEACIHERCWCAHHGCNHRNRTTCDQDITHDEGSVACGYTRLIDCNFKQ